MSEPNKIETARHRGIGGHCLCLDDALRAARQELAKMNLDAEASLFALEGRIAELEQQLAIKSTKEGRMTTKAKSQSAAAPGGRPSLVDWQLYEESAVIHAAVHTIAQIAIGYHARMLVARSPRAIPLPTELRFAEEKAGDELFEDLIQFFGDFDRMRSEQVENLTARVTELLISQAAPMHPALNQRTAEPGAVACPKCAALAKEPSDA
jgi:hypothetical protein